MFKNKLAKLLEEAKKNGISAAKIAEELGLKRSQFSDWKVGRNTPSAENLQKIANYFNVTTDYLLKPDEEDPAHATDIKNFGNNNTILIGSNNNQVGNSTVSSINNEETELLQLYRSLTPAQRSAFLTLAKSLK